MKNNLKISSLVFVLVFSLLVPLFNVMAYSDGVEDVDFYTNYIGSGFNDTLQDIVEQPDGKILIAGNFTTFNGNTRNRLIRLNSDGTEDTDFYTNLGSGFDNRIWNLVLQPDGKILIAGNFTTFNGNTRNRLVRLNPDGTEDIYFYTNLGSGFYNRVWGIGLQSDNKIIVGGTFVTFNGNTRNRLVRLNPDGTEDTDFYTNLGSGFTVNNIYDLNIQPDDKILIVGSFSIFNGNTRNSLIRLNSDGTEDIDFYTNLGSGFNTNVWSVVIQPDGKILIGGGFSLFNGNSRIALVRLNSDGTEDIDFYTNLGSGFNYVFDNIRITRLQEDGDILVGGIFSSLNGNTRYRVVRLNSDGTEDTAFYTNLGSSFENSNITAFLFQSNGGLLVGGDFTLFNGNTRNRLVRLFPDITPPILSESIPISTLINDTTPSYTFISNEDGTITYGGSCSSITTTAIIGNNTITFDSLLDGTYSDCTITLTDSSGNVSTPLTVSTFTIDTTLPTLTEVTQIGSTTDQTPSYTFNTTEAGTITYGGSCTSTTTESTIGDNIIIFNELESGTYSDCTITITDSAGNVSTPLTVSTFIIKRKPSSGSYASSRPINITIPSTVTIEPITITPSPISNNTYISPLDNKEHVCTPFTKYLKKGDKTNDKEEVKLWQAFLNKYENETLVLDGIYGIKTEGAIKRFQNKYKQYILTPWNLTSPTGYTYQSTRAYGNKLLGCREGEVILDNGVKINF